MSISSPARDSRTTRIAPSSSLSDAIWDGARARFLTVREGLAILTATHDAGANLDAENGILSRRWPRATLYREPAATAKTGPADPIAAITSVYDLKTFSLRHVWEAPPDEARLARLPRVNVPPTTAHQERPHAELRYVDISKLLKSPEWEGAQEFARQDARDHDHAGAPAHRRRARAPFEIPMERVRELSGDDILDPREVISRGDPSRARTFPNSPPASKLNIDFIYQEAARTTFPDNSILN